MKFDIVIRSINREPKKNYLSDTINSFMKVNKNIEMINGISIYVGNSDLSYITNDIYENKLCSIIKSEYKLTPNENGAVALQTKSVSDYIIFCEDDIEFCEDYINKIYNFILNDVPKNFNCITFYCPYKENLESYENGNKYWEYPIEKFYGTQCFLLRRTDANEFGNFIINNIKEFDVFKNKMIYIDTNNESMRYRCLDFWLKEFLGYKYPDMKYMIAISPCLVQHIGEESTLNNKFHINQSYIDKRIHKNGYWLDKNIPHHFDINLAKRIHILLYQKYTIADLGCGDGSYVKYFISQHRNSYGVDGKLFDDSKYQGFMYERDLTVKNLCVPEADVVLCLEVAEHIPKEKEDIFLDNLCSIKNLKILIISWAVKGQGGYGHINEQDNEYVIKKINKYGFELNECWTDLLRKVSKLSWFKKSILVFKKYK